MIQGRPPSGGGSSEGVTGWGSDRKMSDEPHVQRARGWLKNSNPPGDFSRAPRCGAQTRHQTKCLGPAMRNGRCRFHGGLSTGPRTPQGLERSRRARWRHGARSREARELRAKNRRFLCEVRALLDGF